MNVFKKIFKVVIIILGIVLFFKLLGMVVFESHKNKSSELIDFKPTESLKIKTSTPIFYYSDKKLFYSKNGEINLTNHIWKGEINERYYENKVFVSPNSNFIAFDNNGSIKVLNKKGDSVSLSIKSNNLNSNIDAKIIYDGKTIQSGKTYGKLSSEQVTLDLATTLPY